MNIVDTRTTLFVLDAGMLSLLTNPTASAAALECHRWTRDLLRQGGRFAIPEIADYEVRRELLRNDRMRALRALDDLKAVMFYLPLSTDALLRASEIWAAAKKFGRTDLGVGVREGALDMDIILAAQALVAGRASGLNPVVVTTHVAHLGIFAQSDEWHNLRVDDRP